MEPLSVSTTIGRPREEVFAYLEDIANHPEFSDHYLVDWRMTRTDTVGRGAGARFRYKAPLQRFDWADVTFIEVSAPRRIVQAGRGGKANRNRLRSVWDLDDTPAGTRVTLTVETRPALPSDRMMEALGLRGWLRRNGRRALKRMRRILEEGKGRGPRATIGGLDELDSRPMIRRAALIAFAALLVAGCGNKQKATTFADNEGLYLDLGGLKYQVEMSRQLNPYDVEDHSYLTGVPRALARLAPGESWFAVFIRVENGGSKYKQAAGSFTLKDTQGKTFLPVPISRANPFSYHGGFVAPKNTLPPASSVAQANESIGGALVLFKVPNASYANRPLDLTIRDPRNQTQTATVELDV